MPNAKNNYPGPINDTDKKTLAGAGVDVSDTPLKSEEEETNPPVDPSAQSGEKFVDIDGTPDASDADVQDTGIRFVKEGEPVNSDTKFGVGVNKEDLSSLAETKMKASAKDLEEEFKSELADEKPAAKTKNQKEILGKSESLSELLARIEEKLGHKKSEVKDELTSLKKMKDTITKDINEIKDLEASEEKIKDEIEKIESIREEVEHIEEELNDKV